MNGAESLIRTASTAGVEVCFANPGTTEMPLVIALDAIPGIRPVLCLFEGVCTGAADGYGRMRGKPALTLLHLGPGFANGIANLHNARRAYTPVVNLIGDHATWHVEQDAPLTSDIESLARPVSSWLRSNRTASALAGDAAEAISAAGSAPGGVATLIVPADCQWEGASGSASTRPSRPPSPVPAQRVRDVAEALRADGNAALLLGGVALRDAGLRAAARVAAATECRLISDTFVARLERGAGRPQVERLPYFPEQAIEFLSNIQTLAIVGTRTPVAFFGYPDVPSRLAAPEANCPVLANPGEDIAGALEALADMLGAPATPGKIDRAAPSRPERPSGPLDPARLGAALAAVQPEGAIVVDEAATSGLPYFVHAAACPPHDYLALTGGAIGQGLPCATGAAIACPDRPVIAFQADGSALYTVQSLWTQAREELNVTTVLCSNRSYRILQVELARAGVAEPGPAARALTDLSRPDLDWSGIARGLGVPATRVATAEELTAALKKSFSEPGPQLIEVPL